LRKIVKINSNNIEKEMILFVQEWFDLISDGKINEACNIIDQPNCYGIKWTPEKVQETILNEFGQETVFGAQNTDGFFFSKVKETNGSYRADVLKFDDESGYSVEHDVPLNGKWSDLTAQFEFIGKPPLFEFILHDFHVL
ncbi:hypothetical protein M3P05_20720, partial [Sansalvadorimonas sp. 2012CJ34-2]